jgi:hypothetical protein
MESKGAVRFIQRAAVYARITWRLKMTEDDGCRGIIGALLGHKFEARYSEKNIQSPGDYTSLKLSGSAGAIERILNARDITREYEYDICVRCGKIVKKAQE